MSCNATESAVGCALTCECKNRQDKFRELEGLTRMIAILKEHTMIRMSLEEAAQCLICELYPKYDEPQVTLSGVDSQAEIRSSVSDEELDEASSPDRKAISYTEMIAHLMSHPGSRAAREGWDNGLNMEFIESVTGLGVVKHFYSSKITGHKEVRHSYNPSDDDQEAEDWYIV